MAVIDRETIMLQRERLLSYSMNTGHKTLYCALEVLEMRTEHGQPMEAQIFNQYFFLPPEYNVVTKEEFLYTLLRKA